MSDYKPIKISLVGLEFVGKSSLLRLLSKEAVDSYYTSTIGADIRVIYAHDKKIKISIWDLSGAARFKTIISNFIETSDIVVFCYSAKYAKSFTNMVDLYRDYKRENLIKNQKILIVATKIDLATTGDYKISGTHFAEQIGAEFFETSSVQKIGGDTIINHITKRDQDPLRVHFSDTVETHLIPRLSKKCCNCVIN